MLFCLWADTSFRYFGVLPLKCKWFYFALLLLVLAGNCLAKQALIIGDSHLYGKFGETLHRILKSQVDGDIVSIASCPASPKTYLAKDISASCGLKVRKSFSSDEKPGSKINTALNMIRGNTSALSSYINYLRPELIIVALGTNMGNQGSKMIISSARQLATYIARRSPMSKIFWVGPPTYRGSSRIVKAISLALQETKVKFIDGQPYNRKKPLPRSNPHFGPKGASRWAKYIAEKVIISFNDKQKIYSMPEHCYRLVEGANIPSIRYVGIKSDNGRDKIRLGPKSSIKGCLKVGNY